MKETIQERIMYWIDLFWKRTYPHPSVAVKPLEWWAISLDGHVQAETISMSRNGVENNKSHLWWLEHGDRAKVVKLKLVVEEA